MNIRANEAASSACYKAQGFGYALVFAPAEARAASMAPLRPVLERMFNVQLEFFETDSSLRTTNLFRARQLTDVSYEGESCWISFRVTFLDGAPSSCFMDVFKDTYF